MKTISLALAYRIPRGKRHYVQDDWTQRTVRHVLLQKCLKLLIEIRQRFGFGIFIHSDTIPFIEDKVEAKTKAELPIPSLASTPSPSTSSSSSSLPILFPNSRSYKHSSPPPKHNQQATKSGWPSQV
jgi:hypothetical protein